MTEPSKNIIENNPLIKRFQRLSKIVLGEILFILGVMTFIQLMFRATFYPLFLLIYMSSIIFYIVFTKKEDKKASYKMFELSTLVLVLYSVTAVIQGFAKNIETSTGADVTKMNLTLCIVVYITLILGYLTMLQTPKYLEIKELLIVSSIKSFSSSSDAADNGDVIIGKYDIKDVENATSSKLSPLRIRFKDRFLHLLILGPTGCGKTSKVIIPAITQDLQNRDFGLICMEPKGDLADKVWALSKIYDRDVLYFKPTHPDCPYFNPLYGDESDVVENLTTTFSMLTSGSTSFFIGQADNLLRRSIKLLKRLYGNDANILQLNDLVWNINGKGEDIVMEFRKVKAKDILTTNENDEISGWFLNDYFTGNNGSQKGTKTYEHCSGIRTQIAKLCSNEYLRKVMNPPSGTDSKGHIDFDKALAEGQVISISTEQGSLRGLGKYLGFFLIFQLQAAVFRRPGTEDDRRPCMLYIDEFQVFANPGFEDMLTQGRSYRVASHLATQNRSLISDGSREGKRFLDVVSTNARNIIIFPGANSEDAIYYSKQFGEKIEKKLERGITRQRYNPVFGWGFKAPSESTRYTEKKVEKYSVSDIIYKNAEYVIARIIDNMNIQLPVVARVDYIPEELNKQVKEIASTMMVKNEDYKREIYSDNLIRKHIEPLPNSISFEDIEEEIQDDDALILIQNEEDLTRRDTADIEEDTLETSSLFEPDEEDLTSPEEDIF